MSGNAVLGSDNAALGDFVLGSDALPQQGGGPPAALGAPAQIRLMRRLVSGAALHLDSADMVINLSPTGDFAASPHEAELLREFCSGPGQRVFDY